MTLPVQNNQTRFSRRAVLQSAAAIGAAGILPNAFAQTYPSKPIKVLIGVPAGGTQDILTRALAESLRSSLGPIIIDNKSGGSGRLAVETVKNAEPDGHTLLLDPMSLMTMFPSAYKKLNYDPFADFIPIINAASFELAPCVHSSVPANNLSEFVAWAKTQGNKVNFASYGAGTPSHFLGEMLNQSAGLQMVHIPYKGSTPARQDLMGGTVQAYFDTVGGAITMQPTGRIKVLATSGSKRSPPLPSIPTFLESGYKDFIAAAWFAYYVPAKTSKPIVDKLRAEFMRAVNSRDLRQQLLINGMYPVGDGPEALVKTMREDTARWAKIMKSINFAVQD